MSDRTAAVRYARAAFDVADEADVLDRVSDELARAAEVLAAQPRLVAMCERPGAVRRDGRRMVDEAFTQAGFCAVTLGLLAAMCDNGRLALVDAVRHEYDILADAELGRIDATLLTAKPLGDDRREALVRALEKRTGRKVNAHVKEDPALIGGVRIRLGNTVLDGSARGLLGRVRKQFE